MTKIIFDTNIHSYAAYGYEPMEELIDHYNREGSSILMPTIVQAELMSIPKSRKDLEFKNTIDGFIALSKAGNFILPMNDEIIRIASDVRIEWREKRNKKLALPDAIIGATAVVENATLFSNNDRDFSYFVEEYGLRYENPIDQQDLHEFLQGE